MDIRGKVLAAAPEAPERVLDALERLAEELAAAAGSNLTALILYGGGHVMLTLTAANVGEALPLAEALRGRCGRFAFSRLARAGRGAALEGVSPAAWESFAARWTEAAAQDRRLALKDGLLNRALAAAGRPLSGGCTGAGCGAAFNFLAVLPDGEVHACRKLASRIGHLGEASLEEIWSSPEAARWREGSRGCRGCALRAGCGGCLAVAQGEGLDPLEDRDPLCPGPVPRRARGLAEAARALWRRAAGPGREARPPR